MKSKFKHPQVPRSTKFSRLTSILWLGLLAIGCGSSPAPEATPTVGTANQPSPQSFTVGAIPVVTDNSLALSIDGRKIRPGDDDSDALLQSGRPKAAFDLRDPAPFPGTDLRARGWESDSESFAVLAKEGKVMAAVYSLERATRQDVEAMLADLERANGAAQQFTAGTYTNYRFWYREGVRLMLCDTLDSKSKLSATMAVGESNVMTGLRMDPASAEKDMAEAHRILRQVLEKS